jgi:hypothetical protein
VKPVGEPDAGDRHVRFDERGWETERCRMAQATAPILDSTISEESISARNVRRDLTYRMRRGLGRPPALFPVTHLLLKVAFRAAGREEDFRRLTGTLVGGTAALRGLGWAPSISTEEGLAALMRNSRPGYRE